jgi:hypothetical protein
MFNYSKSLNISLAPVLDTTCRAGRVHRDTGLQQLF